MEKRIVSLLPSSTEIVCSLGFESSLVGRSHECDFPKSITSLPVCTEAKIKLEGTSKEIDEKVKTSLEESLSIYRIFSDVLEKLSPDIIVTQDQCEVCAVSLKDVEQTFCNLTNKNVKIVTLTPNSLDDVYNDIIRVAKSLDVEERGNDLVEGIIKKMERIKERAMLIKKNPPTCYCIEWIEPLIMSGNWVPELVNFAGGNYISGKNIEKSIKTSFEDLLKINPDIIVVMPCGFDIDRSREEMEPLLNNDRWNELKAVKNKQVYLTDGNQYFNRPGPRLLESVEILSEIFYPEEFGDSHKGTGWVQL